MEHQEDLVIKYLDEHGFRRTVRNYIEVSTFNDAHRLSELGVEDAAEVEELIEEGILKRR